jgi:hypothetical protein
MASSSSFSSSTTTTTTTIPIPEHFICPISGEIFIDPVFASDGQTYEREDIAKWIRQNGYNATSPLTGIKLRSTVLTPNHSMKSQIAAWQQKNNNGAHLEKAFKDLVGDLMTASSSEALINIIKRVSNLVESSDKILVTMKKLEKWIIAIDDELLTDEVISSFDVLKSQVLVITKRKEIELKQLSDINKCQSLMMEKKKEESIQIDLDHKKIYDKYEMSKVAFEKAREKMNNDELELKCVKKAKDTNAKQIEILAGLIQQSISEMNNNNNIVCGNSSSNNSNGKRDLSNIGGSSRKSKLRKTNSNNFNNDVDLSFGARKLFEDGFNHAVVIDSKLFLPLKYQTMVEASAYGGFELAIGYCHLHGLGKFVKDEKKGYNIINKYIKTNKDNRLAQYLMADMYFVRGVTGKILEIICKSNDGSGEGVSMNTIQNELSKAGFDVRTLRHTVATMCDDGLLYSTFDDDHFEICPDDVEEPVKIAATGNNITQKILEIICKSNDGSGEGVSMDTIQNELSKAGFDVRTLRHTVATMCDDSLLYSTVDDDHFLSIF